VTLARMDRAQLRCAIGEVLHSPTPARVAIAEWVELARIYSGDPTRRLMNGVLGSIAAGSVGP
jgi:transcription termination factor NusB